MFNTLRACALACLVAPSVAAEGGAPSPAAPPVAYWCSMDKVAESWAGADRFPDGYGDERRPGLVTVPLQDKADVIHEATSADGRYYLYARQSQSAHGPYVIHGVFDRQDRVLVTSRSAILPLEAGAPMAVATSFRWVCSLTAP